MAIENTDEFIKKVNQVKKDSQFDLSSDEDLSLAIMNLVSIEEHFFFTAQKTGKNEYFDLLAEVREMRKTLLKKIIKDYEGEVWCISKHLLAASMRLMEVGTKHLGKGDKKTAQDFFQKSYDLYAMFWGLALKMINTTDIKKVSENQLSIRDTEKNGVLGKMRTLVQKVIDCCIE